MDSEESVLIQYSGDDRDMWFRSFTVARRTFERFGGVEMTLRDGARVHRWLMDHRSVSTFSDVLYSLGNRDLSDRGFVYRFGEGMEVRCLGLPGWDDEFGRQHMVDVARTSVNGSFVVAVERPVSVAYYLEKAAFGW